MLRALRGRPLASFVNGSTLLAASSSTKAAVEHLSTHSRIFQCQAVRHYRDDNSGNYRSSRPSARTWDRTGPPRSQPRTGGRDRREGFAQSDEILEGTAEKNQTLITRFDDLMIDGKVHGNIVKTLTQRMGLESMTPVQSQTINETLEGVDMIAQARTGTGKTLAFLVPLIQNILVKDPKLQDRLRSRLSVGPDVRALIISPTRELAEQIASEANKVVAATGVVVQTAVGGTLKRMGLQKIKHQGCHILVGTPGRLHDILSDSSNGIHLGNLTTLVLDEADRLLDDGFLPDIQRIEGLLPAKEQRQNMLFSATVPREVLDLSRQLMNKNAKFVQTIQPGETQTHEKIPQKVVRLAGMQNSLPALLELVTREVHTEGAELPFKGMVFCNSTAETMLYAEMFATMTYQGPTGRQESLDRNCPVLEIHSRLSQPQRTKAADLFKKARHGIMFTSDVSARGMDYPNITHVIQLGLPRSREFYIHRLGRTGRADKKGEGWLFLDKPEESEFRRRLMKLPIKDDTTLQSAHADLSNDANLAPEVTNLLSAVKAAGKAAPFQMKVDAYKAAFGVMGGVHDKQQLVDENNARATITWGMDELPRIDESLAQRLGFSRCQGLNTRGGTRSFDARPDGQMGRSGSRMGRPGSQMAQPGSRSGRYGGQMGRSSGRTGRQLATDRHDSYSVRPSGRLHEH